MVPRREDYATQFVLNRQEVNKSHLRSERNRGAKQLESEVNILLLSAKYREGRKPQEYNFVHTRVHITYIKKSVCACLQDPSQQNGLKALP